MRSLAMVFAQRVKSSVGSKVPSGVLRSSGTGVQSLRRVFSSRCAWRHPWHIVVGTPSTAASMSCLETRNSKEGPSCAPTLANSEIM